jgi:hypothetical protein
VGVLAYELLMGRLPYQASDPLALALMHAQDPVPRLPPEKKHWQPFLDRAMAKSPDNRYRNAQQMLSALNQIAGGKPAEPMVDMDKLGAFFKARWQPMVSGLAGVALVVVAVAWLQRDRPAEPETDFFTVQDSAPAATAPAPAAAPPVNASPEPAANAPTPVDAALANAAQAPAPGLLPVPFSQVTAEVSVVPLDYDPTRAGARELAAARRQIDRQRLSLPPGDNAMQSLREAMALAPREPALPRLADEVVAFYATRVQDAVAAGKDDDARDNYQRVAPFVAELKREEGKPWAALRAWLTPVLLKRLQDSLAALDGDAVDRTKALATALEVPSQSLEPAWSQAIRLPKAGDPLKDTGVAMVLATVPRGNRAGLAAMRAEVTRSEYAAFASGTGRPATRCRNRLAPISLKKRTWDNPGFNQGGNHPVVCVSYDDARAYAQWLSRRTGNEYRLPTRSEWTPLAAGRGSGNACSDGRVACGSEGTVSASQGPASGIGLTGMRGNAREWLSDCARGCQRRLVAGAGWRDPPARVNAQQSDDFDADTGFDDIGFRLVRAVKASELGAR